MTPITIKDIAREAGVSTATVSYVINKSRPVMPEKHKRVMDVISKTNYQPNRVAKSLRTKKTNIIGVLAEDILSFPAVRIINGISEYIEKTDYNILLNDLRMLDSLYNKYDQVIHQKDKINKALSFLVYGAKVDAIIYVGMFDRDISEILSNINKPIIIAYSTSVDEHTCSVSYENENAAAELTKYVINCGHKHIAVITGIAHTAPAQERLKGINRSFKESGLVLDSTYVRNGDWERASGYVCMKDLLDSHSDALPTAVLAMNDLMAIGAMDAIRDNGLRIPEDISVAGFDNREVSEFVYPKLTTVEIDLQSIGYTAALMATQKLSGHGEYADKRNIIVPSKLQIRDTVSLISNL
ncbi:MAG: LacI family transcriptional regulator [Oscillospiraceae bacterium]|nr:LacI family transcriptional regulator [Oscillospiraceae bacterium]